MTGGKGSTQKTVIRIALAALIALGGLAVVYATAESLRTARELGDRALEGSALAISSSVERALRSGKSSDEVRTILSDRVVAYALIADSRGKVLFHVNPELEGETVPDFTHGNGPPEKPRGEKLTLGLGTPGYEYDYPIRLEDGEPLTLRVVLHLGSLDTLDEQGRRLWLIIAGVLLLLAGAGVALERALTGMTRLRDEYDRRERLALIGQMTATLAHEIRNAVWGVKGYAQWMGEKLPADSPAHADVEKILIGTGRIEHIVDDLLVFSREENYLIEVVPLGPVVAEVAAFVSASWPGTVELDVEEGLSVSADRDALHRVLLNGARNASQAMGGGGVLTISARRRGGFAVIRLADTGKGISPEVAEKLFTPFFTTKTDGTGLGLAYSRKVVEAMKGEIGLENGQVGAVLSIRLPAAARDGS